MEARLSSLVNKVIGPQRLASEITSILLDACELAEIKPVKIKNPISGSSKPWFDKDCQKLKNSIKKNCKKLRNNKSDITIQEKISSENKQLKKLLKKKEKDYKLNSLTQFSTQTQQVNNRMDPP